VWDSGDVLALLSDLGVQLVLCGHEHVPYVWLLDGVLVVNSGTVSSYRLRGYVRPSYNLVEVDHTQIRVDRQLETSPELAGMFTKSTWRA
jgi:3',5'-cyclic-AMP phosphodiesterase